MQWYKQQSKTKQAGVGCLTVVIAMWLLGAILGSGDDAPPVAVTPAEDTPAADAPADEPAATDAPTDPPATTQTPAAEAPGDAGEPSTIPGLAAVDIYGNLETRGFTCERGSTSEGFVATCRDAESNDVVARGTGPMSIKLVTATSLGLSGGDDEARVLLGFVASVPYDGAEPDAARAWVEENVGKNTETMFGGAKFRLIAVEGGSARILEITPAEE